MAFYEIVFSPTGGTKKAAGILAGELAKGLADGSPVHSLSIIDLTDGRADFAGIRLAPNDTVLIAVPSYGGRVPLPAGERLAQIKGNGAKAVLVCVYGNRAYEDTLAELQDIAETAGFAPAAAVAALAEHSIAHRYGSGRPDSQDGQQLRFFAAQILSKLSAPDQPPLSLPGNRPYKPFGVIKLVPVPAENCTQCGLCAVHCPVQAIDSSDVRKTDTEKCISCMRCAALCPQKARQADPQALSAVEEHLKKVCALRKEPELYI